MIQSELISIVLEYIYGILNVLRQYNVSMIGIWDVEELPRNDECQEEAFPSIEPMFAVENILSLKENRKHSSQINL